MQLDLPDDPRQDTVPFGDVVLPVLLPVAVTLLQTLLWDVIAPFAWLLYLPAVAAAAWFCGLTGGLLTLCLSLGCAEWLLLGLDLPTPLPAVEGRAVLALVFALMSLGMVPLRQTSCRPDRIHPTGAMMEGRRGSIRTRIQRQSGG